MRYREKGILLELKCTALTSFKNIIILNVVIVMVPEVDCLISMKVFAVVILDIVFTMVDIGTQVYMQIV